MIRVFRMDAGDRRSGILQGSRLFFPGRFQGCGEFIRAGKADVEVTHQAVLEAVEVGEELQELPDPEPLGQRPSASQSAAGPRRIARLGPRPAADGSAPAAPTATGARSRRALGALVVHDLADFTLTAAKPLPFQVDGDALDKRDYVRFREIPRALEVFI